METILSPLPRVTSCNMMSRGKSHNPAFILLSWWNIQPKSIFSRGTEEKASYSCSKRVLLTEGFIPWGPRKRERDYLEREKAKNPDRYCVVKKPLHSSEHKAS